MRRNYCRSVVSLQEPLPHSLWISLDFHGILAIVWTPAYPVVSICVCWPPKRRVYNIKSSCLLQRKYLLLLCCLLKVSQYQLARQTQPLSTLSRVSPTISILRFRSETRRFFPLFFLNETTPGTPRHVCL